MLKFKIITVMTFAIALQSCSMITSSSKSASLGGIIIPEPTPVDFKYEVVISRLNDIIQRADISETQRATLYYERGLKYDSVGLRHLARIDFNHALRLKPDYADAYNFLGIHLTQIQEFNYAYEAFDSAIELSIGHEYAYFNRGVALYYGARPKLAREDLSYFYKHQVNDAFRILWLYFSELKMDPIKAQEQLMKKSEAVGDDEWVKNIIHLYLNNISQQDLLDRLMDDMENYVEGKVNKQLNERLCEAYFYLGKYNLLMNNKTDAEMFFKLALSTNVYEYVEHRYAQVELDLIRNLSPSSY